MWLFLVLQLSCFSVKPFAIVFVARLIILDYYSLYCWTEHPGDIIKVKEKDSPLKNVLYNIVLGK